MIKPSDEELFVHDFLEVCRSGAISRRLFLSDFTHFIRQAHAASRGVDMPPYSDNLYSGDLSDGEEEEESFNAELSPSDGYFGRPEMPTNRLVPDPMNTKDVAGYGALEPKTLIDPPNSPPQSGSSSRLPRHHPAVPPMSSSPPYVAPGAMSPVTPVIPHRRLGSFSEQDPLISHAPPAYSESPPQSSSTSQGLNSYSTFPEQQLERGFFTRREPESMGGHAGGLPTENTPLVAGGVFSPRRRKIKALICAGLILAVIGSTLAIVFGCVDSVRLYHCLAIFTNKLQDSKASPIDSNAEYCPAAIFKNDQTVYGFTGGKELNIIHKIKEQTDAKSYPTISAEGEIRLRKAPVNSTHGNNPYITVDMGSSTRMTTTLDWSEDSQTLRLTTPRYSDLRYTSKTQCLYVIITAWFPKDTELSSILFDSPTLNLALSDVKLNVTSRARFTTSSGSVWLTTSNEEEAKALSDPTHPAVCSKPAVMKATGAINTDCQFASRRTTVETISGDITGTYPLLDDLIISSESGDVVVFVSPQAASKGSSAPADLEVQTSSGNIYVEFPITDNHPGAQLKSLLRGTIPDQSVQKRDYITRVHSTSGNIKGFFYLGSESNFKTTSGGVEVYGLPVLPVDEGVSKLPLNTFETHTLSGATDITVREPILFSNGSTDNGLETPLSVGDNDPYRIILPPTDAQAKIITSSKLRSLRSAHSSNTGRIKARYPDAWQGSVHVKTVNGEIEVKGEGFRTVKEKTGWAFREVEKLRGVDSKREASTVDISNISGDVTFSILD